MTEEAAEKETKKPAPKPKNEVISVKPVQVLAVEAQVITVPGYPGAPAPTNLVGRPKPRNLLAFLVDGKISCYELEPVKNLPAWVTEGIMSKLDPAEQALPEGDESPAPGDAPAS